MTNIIWITGASMGIGAALAQKAAAEGWIVAASARSADKLDQLDHPNIHSYPLDVMNAASVAKTVQKIEDDIGPITIAVLNAGTHADMPAAEFDAAECARIFNLNLTGTTNCVDPLLKHFLERGRGQVALMASVAGYVGLPRAAAYCASKAGTLAMAESLQAELGHRGITVQVICPGFVRTPLTDKNPFPMPFLMEPEDAANRIWAGLQSKKFEIAFPKRFAYQLKFLAILPRSLYFWLIRKATKL